MASELKPCPFCGGKAQINHEPNFVDENGCKQSNDWYVECTVCGFARLPSWGTIAYDTRKQAIVGWNRRTSCKKS